MALCKPTIARKVLLLVTLVAGAIAPVASAEQKKLSAAEVVASYEKEVRPVFAQFCFDCHNAKKQKGDLNLEDSVGPDVFRGIRDRLHDMEMPPKARPQPPEAVRTAVVAWISRNFGEEPLDCNQIASDQNTQWYEGHVMGRRLNRTEYGDTLRDLLGVEVRVDDLIAEDGGGGEGFDTAGDALFLSAISLEKYLQAADRGLAALFDAPADAGPATVAAARARLISAHPDAHTSPRDAAKKDLSAFAARAFRRDVTDAQLERYLKLFNQAQSRKVPFEKSLRLAMKGMLVSPNFLFLSEPFDSSQSGVYPLDEFALASRLSYFLWASMPDDQLFSLAREKRLQDPEVLKQQVHRMLKDPRSLGLAESFSRQWLGITALGGSNRPDPKRFADFDDDLVSSEKQEAALLLHYILREDRSLLDLINADYTFLNQRLARLYGIPGISGNELRRVVLSSDSRRGGVLGLAAVLTTTSYPLRTSPVLRGKWVLEQILGEKMRPPPPNVPSLPADDHQTDGLTFRQRLEQHRTHAECAGCHTRMDPLGFGLENFDPMGRWRDTEAGGPIDAKGALNGGESFSGPQELRAALLKHKDQFLNNFARKMLGYALGRGLGRFDDCVVNDSLKALADNNDHASVLIEKIVLSKPFRYRYVKK